MTAPCARPGLAPGRAGWRRISPVRSATWVGWPPSPELASARLLALAVLEDPRRLLDGAALLRGCAQDRVELALTDDDVHLAADTAVGQQFLDVEESAGRSVDRVVGAAVAEHGPGDRHLGVVDRQRTIGVVDGQADLRATEGRTACRAREDDVLHLAAAQALGALLPHDPGEGIDDIGLAGAVGADDAGDARLEAHRRRRREGLEALEGQCLDVHGCPCLVRADRPLTLPARLPAISHLRSPGVACDSWDLL